MVCDQFLMIKFVVLLFYQTKAAYKIDAVDVRIIYDTNQYDENVYVFQ